MAWALLRRFEDNPPEVNVKFFEELGHEFHARWKAHDFDLAPMPDIAVRTLDDLAPSRNVTDEAIIDWALATEHWPVQTDPTSRFGNPAITVFTGERFFVDVLFWVDGTTSIHEHSFSGAFHVLAGSSIHSRYRFEAARRYGAHMATGELTLESIERLHRGATRPILSGDRMIHALFHLERPSISVVLRTHHDIGSGHQMAYSRCGLATASFYDPLSTFKHRQVLTLVSQIKKDELFDRARTLIRASDSFAAYSLLDHMRQLVPRLPELRAFYESVLPAHENLVRHMITQAEDRRREHLLVRRRALIRQPEHRFFLAVLLNAPTRAAALDLIAREYPAKSAVDTIMEWVRDLSAMPSPEGEDENPMGIAMNESALEILRHLLEGASDLQVLARLRETYDEVDGQEEDVARMCRAFRNAALFRTLLG